MKDNYPYYFLSENKVYSDKGYLVNGYYINLQMERDIVFLGIVKLNENGYLYQLVDCFRKILKEHKTIYIWAYEDNKKMIELLDKTHKFFSKRGVEISKFGEGVIFYRFKEV